MNPERKILIIEDEAALSDALRDKFAPKGNFVVFQAKDGEEGMAIALRERPDFILLDIVMPKMDGITMLNKLRAENEWGKTVPVIILTNVAEMGKIAADLKGSKVSEYIVKSDSKLEDLVDKVCRHFSEQE